MALLEAAWRSWRRKSILQAMAEAHALSFRIPLLVLVFFGVGYVLWLNAFANNRYLLPLEMLSGTLLVVIGHRFPEPKNTGRPSHTPYLCNRGHDPYVRLGSDCFRR